MCALSNFKAAAYLVPQRCQLGVLEGRSFLFHLGNHIINSTGADVFLIDGVGLLAKGSLFKQCKERVMQGPVIRELIFIVCHGRLVANSDVDRLGICNFIKGCLLYTSSL